MSTLRPECVKAGPHERALSDITVLFLLRQAVAKRRGLIRGRLDDANGRHCAMGCFWADNPKAVVNSHFTDEVAAVNDSLPSSATPKERWKLVMRWLRLKLKEANP